MLYLKLSKSIRKYIVPVVILALTVIIFIFSEARNKAAFDFNNINFDEYKSNAGDKFKEITIEDNLKGAIFSSGKIVIFMRSKAAADDEVLRYYTEGYNVSFEPSPKTATAKGYTGPSVPKSVGKITFDIMDKKEMDRSNGYVITRFILDGEKMNNNVLGGYLDRIEAHTTLYLHAIFSTYYLKDNGDKDFQKRNIQTWKDIMNEASWSPDTLKGFEKYYNIPLQYDPEPQPVQLYYVFDGKNEKAPYNTEKYVINDKYRLRNRAQYGVTRKENGEDAYYVISEVKYSNMKPSGKQPPGSPWKVNSNWNESKTMEEFNKLEIPVPFGGLNVYVVYKKVDTLYKNKLYVKYGSDEPDLVWALKSLKVGEKLTWAEEFYYNSDVAEYAASIKMMLKGYEIYPYNNNDEDFSQLIAFRYIGKGTTEEDIINGSYKVIKGGLKVVLIYSKGNEKPTPTPGAGGTPTPTRPPTPVPTKTPTPTPEPTPVPSIPPLVIPGGGFESKPLDTFEREGIIAADSRDNERFIARTAIPSTESLYTQVRGITYNLGYQFTKKVVILQYPIKISKTYRLSWTDAKAIDSSGSEEEPSVTPAIMTEDVKVTQTITVERACAYWEIINFDYYTFDKAVIYNDALPGGKSLMTPNYSYYSPPSISISHSGSQDYHIIPPSEYTNGIDLGVMELSGDGEKPTIPKEDFTYEANIRTGECKVRNDIVTFNGQVIMTGEIFTKETPDLTNLDLLNQEPPMSHRDVFYNHDLVIPELTLNGRYMSHGTLTYRNIPNKVGGGISFYDVPLQDIEDVVVHTPVICDASITTQYSATNISSNDPYVQTLKVDSECVQLVIDPDSRLSDFTVDINNYGTHIGSLGYYTRDFAWGLRDPSVSYIAKKNDIYRNEVKFPFDVFYRNPSGKDEFIPKNTWMRFGHNTPTFYLPMWVNEGIYTVQFRTIAVNGVNDEKQLELTQPYANTELRNYVATDTVKVQVSGRIYGLTIYDVTDYPTWETIFRTGKGEAKFKINDNRYTSGVNQGFYRDDFAYDYTVGTSDQYGLPTGRRERFTLPIVNGSHPKLSNVGILKTGYAVKFKLTTTGNAFGSGDGVVIKPRFYYVDAAGKNRQEVDIYYWEDFNGKNNKLVKMGSALDLTNIKTYQCGNNRFGIPENQLKLMAEIANIPLSQYIWKKGALFTYTRIRISSPFMTYVNTKYLQDLKAGDQYDKIRAAGITDTEIVRRMQTYYCEYFIPAEIRAVKKGYDVYGYANKKGVSKNEPFWLKDGYIIINFDIVTEDSAGNKNLSYLNTANATKGYCAMWTMENPVSNKTSNNGGKKKPTYFEFWPGDFMVYYLDKSMKDDYETYIIN